MMTSSSKQELFHTYIYEFQKCIKDTSDAQNLKFV